MVNDYDDANDSNDSNDSNGNDPPTDRFDMANANGTIFWRFKWNCGCKFCVLAGLALNAINVN